MTERRPHWDQELEQAVSAVLFDCYENGISEEQVYQVIAAVEDWHEKFVMHGAFRVLAERAASAEAQVQRVRKVKRRTKNIYKDGFDVGWNACLAAVLRALDGDNDA